MTKGPMAVSICTQCRCSSAITCTLPKLFIFLSVLTAFSWNTVSLSAAADDQFSYADHCASIVPESTSETYAGVGQLINQQKGYFTGRGSAILSPNSSSRVHNSIQLSFWIVGETNVQGLFKIKANLQSERHKTYYYVGDSRSSRPKHPGRMYHHKESAYNHYQRRPTEFFLDGFWSAYSGKLCMVGSGSGSYLNGHNSLHAVLKLYNLMNSTSVTSLISGTLESLSKNGPNNFEPVSILMLPSMNYQYTLIPNKYRSSGTGSDDPSSSSLQIQTFCSVLSRKVLNYEFELKYSSRCMSAKNCTPFVASDLPHTVSFQPIECFDDTRRLRVLVEFSDSTTVWYQKLFNPNKTLVGEGSWDAKKNQLFVVACKFLGAAGSWNHTQVGDCSTRVSLRFPAIWTIGKTSGVVGQIWSNKTVTELGYFETITFESPPNAFRRILLPGQKYEYTQIDKVTKLCSIKKARASANERTIIYPNPFSYDMKFDMSAKNSEGVVSWGSSIPLSVGYQFYHPTWYSTGNANSVVRHEEYYVAPVNLSNLYNISYVIRIKLQSDAKLGNRSILNEVHISAEGIYDDTVGSLCMVGCRNLGSKSLQPTSDSVDCEIVVKFQFPPSATSGFINGSIESTRKMSDPLYFEHLDFSSAAGYEGEAKRSIWRMDVKITLALISTTLACVFVTLQLFHVKKHPDVLSSISVFMILILTLSCMIPLILNFEVVFTNNTKERKAFLGSGGLLKFNQVIVWALTMVGLLLKLRLLSLTWSARSRNKGTQNELWVMEKKTFVVALLVYAAGALAALLLMNWRNIGTVPLKMMLSLPALKSYAGLVSDGFLLPQILLNMFCNSNQKALSVSFYVGTTFIRVLPHAYDLYRARSHRYSHRQLNKSYIYASPATDLYSIAWDVIIPFGGLLLAGIICLQQKFGGRFILTRRLRSLSEYEKVPTVTEV